MAVENEEFDRDGMAAWYAGRHLKTDGAILEIHYLPAEASPNEIRLLEVNGLVAESTPMEPINFGVGMGGTDPHALYVLDVTPMQWEAIRAGKLGLPDGWHLQNGVAFGRKPDERGPSTLVAASGIGSPTLLETAR